MHKFLRTFSLFIVVFIWSASAITLHARPNANNPAYYCLKVYHYANSQQESMIDNFFQTQLIPALHGKGLANIGVFKALANDTTADKKIYVFIPFKSLKQWEKFMPSEMNMIASTTGDYANAAYDKPAFARVESILVKAFRLSSQPAPSKLTAPKSERVYELRSYESASEKIHINKVQMFNEGGEIDIFSRLDFNPVFYGQVIFGSKMPNLMYMTSFANMNARTEHWKAFSNDAAWKALSAKPEYQHNVSKSDISFLRPTEYSDL